ncbi:MAG: CRISPR-associated endonuclease Cas2 [Patescibacteria group bacterium]
MGKVETAARFKRRKGYVQKALLATVELTGLLLLTAAAPNMLRLLGKFDRYNPKFDYQTRSVASRLAAKGHLQFVKKSGKTYLELTPLGKRRLELERQKSALEKRAKKRWDGRWRMIVFDIPEKHRRTRNQLRNMLRDVGFTQLQASVWVYPYDCEEIATLLKAELRVGANVLYVVVEHIEYDTRLRHHFGLKL